jgi:hypothetical protein
MKFAEINLFGVYVAPISLMIFGVRLARIALRRIASRVGLLRRVWHPALRVFAAHVLAYWMILILDRWSSLP